MARPAAFRSLLLNQQLVAPTGGVLYVAGVPVVMTTGAQGVSGAKTFGNQATFNNGIIVDGYAFDDGVLNAGGGTAARVNLANGTLTYDFGIDVPTVDWQNLRLRDSNNSNAATWDVNNRVLYKEFGVPSVNWTSGALVKDGIATVDWENRFLLDTGSIVTVNWGARQLWDSTENAGIDWQNRQFSGNWQTNTIPTNGFHIVNRNFLQTGSYNLPLVVRQTGTQTVSGGKTFIDTATFNSSILVSVIRGNPLGSLSANMNEGRLYDANGDKSVDWSGKILYYGSDAVLNWGTSQLRNSSSTALDWSTRVMYDYSSATSIDWVNRNLSNSSSVPTLNYNNRQLSGDWLTNTAPTTGRHVVNLDYLQTGDWTYTRVKGRTTSGTPAATVTVDWRSGHYVYQPLSGNLSVTFTGAANGQSLTIATYTTGASLITWPTGAGTTAGVSYPIKWAGNAAFSGTSGSAATGKMDAFQFVCINNTVLASYSANHY